LPSLAVADDPIRLPIRCFARPSSGMITTLLAARAMPTMLSSACEPLISARTASMATYRASTRGGVASDGFRPDRYDSLGAAVCLMGVAVIMYAPR
jgi:hypothetical protein